MEYHRGSFSSSSSNSLLLERFGYNIGKKIGIGSYSTVRVAYSNKQKNLVALKIIWKDRASALFQKEFLPREIDIVKTLRHPNIVQYFQCIETNRRFIIAMEYAQCGSLLDLMGVKNVLTEAEARTFFRQLIGALEFCHSKLIAHRDLKLENLLLFWEKKLKIGDFGFGRYFNIDDPSTTFSLTFCGSNAYISPEILHQRSYNPLAADVWACGVILYAMVFGRLPFDDSGSIQHLTQLVDGGLIFPADRKISLECSNLITNMMTNESMRPTIRSVLKDPWISSNTEQ